MTRAPMKVIYEPPLRTVMIAGGAGFVGGALCDLLASDGALRVISVDHYTEGLVPRETGNFRAVNANIADRARLTALMAEEAVDTVVDLTRGGDRSLAEVAQACWATSPPSERERCRFIALAADDRQDARGHPDLPLVRAITTAPYGPGQSDDALIPATVLNALVGAPVWISGAGLAQCDWLHVEDLAMALLTLLVRGQVGASYAIGARETHSVLGTVATICDLVDRMAPRADGRKHRSLIRFRAARTSAHPAPLDPGRIERELGWHAQIGFRDGLIETIDWYRRRVAADRLAVATSA